jgi:hypothetical protein
MVGSWFITQCVLLCIFSGALRQLTFSINNEKCLLFPIFFISLLYIFYLFFIYWSACLKGFILSWVFLFLSVCRQLQVAVGNTLEQTGISKSFLNRTQKTQHLRETINKHQTKELLHSKGNSHQTWETAHRMGENLCQQLIWEGTNQYPESTEN